MGNINSYRDLIVWQKSMRLVTDIYSATKLFPSEELYGLTSQGRRCAVSIPGNIAEGYGRNLTGDYKRFLQIAAGSYLNCKRRLKLQQIWDTFLLNRLQYYLMQQKKLS